MEKRTERRNYAGYLPKRANITKLELYLKEGGKSTPATGNKVQGSKVSRVLKNKRF